MNLRVYLFLSLFFITCFNIFAHHTDSAVYYLVYFKDKSKTQYQIQKPEDFLSKASIERRKKYHITIDSSDLPIDAIHLNSLKQIKEAEIMGVSKWLNAVEIRILHSKSTKDKRLQIINEINSYSSVYKVQYLGTLGIESDTDEHDTVSQLYLKASKALIANKNDSILCAFKSKDYGESFAHVNFIGIPQLSRLSERMTNFHIAVFDAGFHKAYRVPGMEDLLDSNTIIRDFVDHDGSVWEDDQHGCNVLSFLKTYHPGNYIGSAPFAKYTLIRTENAGIESLTEEVNWLLAAEFVDSLGVDLISSSVGYNLFDETILSHSYHELDGKTALISRAANLAYSKGMMVVVSAGNEGNKSWRHIGFPADAASVITVGACDINGNYSKFSSVGPCSDGRIKPDFLCPGYKVQVAAAFGNYPGNGTSYATPIFAGAMAQLMYLHPRIALDSLKKTLLKSASFRHLADTFYGNGIPDFALAHAMLTYDSSNSKDCFWVNDYAVKFQDLNIYFYSSKKQNIKILIKANNQKKTIYKTHLKIEQGQWFESDILIQLLLDPRKSKKKIKHGILSLELIFETEYETFQKNYQLN